jgi:hypothetical protein
MKSRPAEPMLTNVRDVSRFWVIAMFIFVLIGSALCQNSALYQVGTIIEVKDHQPTGQEDPAKSYDISVKVGNTIYLVLYTPPGGSDVVQYKTGLDFLVQVDGKTMRFSDALGRPMAVPIVSQRQAVEEKKTPRSD